MHTSRLFVLVTIVTGSCMAACSSESAPAPTIIDSGSIADAAAEGAAPFEAGSADAGCSEGGASNKCIGDPCGANGECASGTCFVGGSRSFCTKTCSGPTDCPSPPYANVCNNQGFCRL
ncbi:MAG: hypothetical protein U0169_08805 [Polyangiaceae bacterium]